MISSTEIRAWLDTLPDNALIGISEGGLCLEEFQTPDGIAAAYLEVGGMPFDEPTEDDTPIHFAFIPKSPLVGGPAADASLAEDLRILSGESLPRRVDSIKTRRRNR